MCFPCASNAHNRFLSTTLTSLSFNIPVVDVADRASVTLTMLLTVVAYKLLLSDSLPSVSYFTLLDWYVEWMLAGVVVSVVDVGVAGCYLRGGEPLLTAQFGPPSNLANQTRRRFLRPALASRRHTAP
jgi:hypothetical protein